MKSYCEDIGTYALMVGNGSIKDNYSFSNALALDWDGNAYLMGDVYVASTGKGQNGTRLAKEPFVINFSEGSSGFTADKTFAASLAAYNADQPLKGIWYGTVELNFFMADENGIVFGAFIGNESIVVSFVSDNTVVVETAEIATNSELPIALTSAEIDEICV